MLFHLKLNCSATITKLVKVCHAMSNIASISTTTNPTSKPSLATSSPTVFFVIIHHFRDGARFTDLCVHAAVFQDIPIAKHLKA